MPHADRLSEKVDLQLKRRATERLRNPFELEGALLPEHAGQLPASRQA